MAEHRPSFTGVKTQRPTLATELREALSDLILQTQLIRETGPHGDAGRSRLHPIQPGSDAVIRELRLVVDLCPVDVRSSQSPFGVDDHGHHHSQSIHVFIERG